LQFPGGKLAQRTKGGAIRNARLHREAFPHKFGHRERREIRRDRPSKRKASKNNLREIHKTTYGDKILDINPWK